jgi:hypothetical protein
MAATPLPRSGTGQSIARQAAGGNPGALGGRRPGLAPVRADSGGGDPVSDVPDPSTFERTYWQVTRNTTQNFGNGLNITWTAEGAAFGDTSWHSASFSTSILSLLASAAYSVQCTVRTATNPGIMTVQVHAAASILAAGFVQVGSSLWESYVHGVIVPDQVSDHTVTVSGVGSGADFTITSADIMFFKL